MKKEKGSSLKQGIVLLCAASILLVGCGEKETGSEQPGIAPMEQTGGESGNTFVEGTETSELEGTNVFDNADTGNADEAATENAQVLYAAQTLLSEKYGVGLEQPEPNFEEYTVGLIDGREVFSFTALDAGNLSYSGEKVGDVTIFGIYPGISVDDAWKKLSAYGFYASPYGEVENCLITGDGFGNISIWFSTEDTPPAFVFQL